MSTSLVQSCSHCGKWLRAHILPTVGRLPRYDGLRSGPLSPQIRDCQKLGEITTAEPLLKHPKTFPANKAPLGGCWLDSEPQGRGDWRVGLGGGEASEAHRLEFASRTAEKAEKAPHSPPHTPKCVSQLGNVIRPCEREGQGEEPSDLGLGSGLASALALTTPRASPAEGNGLGRAGIWGPRC